MAKQKKAKSVHAWVIPALRARSRFWPPINECRNRAKVKVEDGFFKNGNPKYKIMYKCEKCGAIVDKIQVDHKREVGSFVQHGSWDKYIAALFCEIDNLQSLCENCHLEKTKAYQQTLKKNRKSK